MGRRSYEEILSMMETKYDVSREEGLKIIHKKRDGEKLNRRELIAFYDNPNVGKLLIPYEKADKLVRMFANKYTSNLKVKDVEEFYSELMEHLLITTPDNVKLAAVILENKAKDLYKDRKNKLKTEVSMNMSSSMSNEGEEETEYKLRNCYGCDELIFEQEEFTDIEILDLIEKITTSYPDKDMAEKVRTTIIALGYINGKVECLKDLYNEIYCNLDLDRKIELREFIKNSKDGKLTRNIVYKVFLGMKSGINSGSAWKIRDAIDNTMKLFSVA